MQVEQLQADMDGKHAELLTLRKALEHAEGQVCAQPRSTAQHSTAYIMLLLKQSIMRLCHAVLESQCMVLS